MPLPDTEKVSVNLGLVDLGQIDLLVEQGFYSNRTDFIKTAVRNQLQPHTATLQQQFEAQSLLLGISVFSRQALERFKSKGKMIKIRVVGIVVIGEDVTPQLALDTIKVIKVLGALRASDEVRAALADRIEP